MSSQAIATNQGILGRVAPARVEAIPQNSVEPWNVALWVGLALALVGWSDVLLGLYPFRVTNTDWEFGAISNALDSMPLGAIGMATVVIAAISSQQRILLRVLSVLAALISVFLLTAVTLYALAVPVVYKAVPAAMQGQLSLAIAKSFVLAFAYIVMYSVLFRAAWRSSVNRKK